MFWKKKKKKNNDITVELDSGERRQGIRIQPMDDIIVRHETHEFKLLDICFMGLAFAPISNELAIPGTYKSGSQLTISFSLPSFRAPGVKANTVIELHCLVQVVQIRGSTCCSQFVTLEPHTQIQVEQFILDEQKRQIHHYQNNKTLHFTD